MYLIILDWQGKLYGCPRDILSVLYYWRCYDISIIAPGG